MLNLLVLLVAVAVGTAAIALGRLAGAIERRRREATLQGMLALLAPAAAAADQDPKQLVVWYPVAQASRRLFPDAFAELDKAAGGAFPFTKAQVQAAHARCSSDWLAWERAHDAEFSLKAAEVQNEIERSAGQPSPLLRTRLAAVEQQKLERYQQRYDEYVRTSKAFAACMD